MGLRPMSITFPDAAEAVKACLDVPLDRLGTRCEDFFIMVPFGGVFRYGKAQQVLGWEPSATLDAYYRRDRRGTKL